MSLSIFQIFEPLEFADYIQKTTFTRNIKIIQNHHTFKPSYANLIPGRDEMFWLESMRRTHIKDRKWSDIGQNLTTFPSGNIGLCRPINNVPAGIFGANTGAICIEHFGNFDTDGDLMADTHKESIILLNAILCKKFKLSPIKWQIVYHHWYDTKGKKFDESLINSGGVGNKQKTCPGKGFFGGNTITAAETNFFPLVASKIKELSQNNIGKLPAPRFKVTASMLNVRSGPGKSFPILRSLGGGSEISVFEMDPSGWGRISNIQQEWVSINFLIPV